MLALSTDIRQRRERTGSHLWRPSVASSSLSQLLHYLLKHLGGVILGAPTFRRGAAALGHGERYFYCEGRYDHAAGYVFDIGCRQFLNFRFAVHDSAPWLDPIV